MTLINTPIATPRRRSIAPGRDWVKISHRAAVIVLAVVTFMVVPGSFSSARDGAPVATSDDALIVELTNLNQLTLQLTERANANGRDTGLVRHAQALANETTINEAAVVAVAEGWGVDVAAAPEITTEGAVSPDEQAELRNLYGASFDYRYCQIAPRHLESVRSRAQVLVEDHEDSPAAAIAGQLASDTHSAIADLEVVCQQLSA